MIPDPANLRAQIVGTGLIGGSIGLGLRRRGWRVCGSDLDPRRQSRALELGAVDDVGTDLHALITFIATPAGAVAEAAAEALEAARHRHRRGRDQGAYRRQT